MESILFPRGIPQGEESFEAYRERGGYQALEKALREHTPRSVVDEILASGLRGRGGAAFPTGKKWAFTFEAQGYPKYVIANGAENEPGSFKDRLLMENHPHLILEGLIIAAYALSAPQAYIYVHSHFDHALRRLEQAMEQARAAGYLGRHILGSDFSVEVLLFPAPTSYVAGEDTAVLEVIEGKEAHPRQKPPYPATHGLFGKPTLINNVETLANIPAIIARGARWFRTIGTQESPGTMIFSLGEEMNRPGAYELPFGTPMRYLYEECGRGLKSGKPLKAILPGGPSCAFLPPEELDIPLDHHSLAQAGSSLGCGVMRFLDQETCLVEETLRIARFFAQESCGICPACRMETGMLVRLLEQVQQGQGGKAILEQIHKVLDFNRGKGFCNLINMPGPPIESALKLFPQDFEYHLERGRCRGLDT